MKTNVINFFKITNLSELAVSYRLLEVQDLPCLPEQELLYQKNLNKLAEKVSSEIEGPTAIVRRNGSAYIAVPSDSQIGNSTQQLVPFVVKLNPLDEIYTINHAMLSENNREVALQFLNFEIKKQLSNRNSLWRLSGNTFFQRKPVNANYESSIDVYQGFSYSLVAMENDELFICLDVTYKYVDRNFLSSYIDASNREIMESRYKNRRCLYLYGDKWYQIQIMGFGKKINAQEFSAHGRTFNVYDYTLKHAKQKSFDLGKHLDPGSLSIFYKYPNRSMETKHGAACLAKLLLKTDDPQVSSMHTYSKKLPDKRFELISTNICRYFSQLTFNGNALNISWSPLRREVRYFPIPDLKFNNNDILSVRSLLKTNGCLSDFGNERKKRILKRGVIKNTDFDTQYLVLPVSIDKRLARAFKSDIEDLLKKLAPKFKDYKIIPYSVKDGISAYQQIKLIGAALSEHGVKDGCALFILPDSDCDNRTYVKKIHDFLKKEYYENLKFQCATQSNVSSFYRCYPNQTGELEYKVPQEEMKFFNSYLFYLAIQILLTNRKWLYALKEPLNYDLYIGMDVHERYVGFCYFFKNGEEIIFDSARVPKRVGSGRNEKIAKELIIKKVYERLKKEITVEKLRINSIVVLRDGRSFGEEEKALESIIKQLQSERLIEIENFAWGVVDVHKQSTVPLRIATEIRAQSELQNPQIGSYMLLNQNEGVVFNTGYPFKLPGTAKPLFLKRTAGNLDLIKVLRDVFAQSLLAFTAPNKSSSLPIAIKLNDVFLEPLAINVEEEDLEYEEVELNTNEE